MSLEIRLLGPVEIHVDGRSLSVDTRKAVALLAYLAVAGRSQDREHLADLLWPGYSEERGRATLRRTLSALKSGVGDGWIQVDGTTVGLASEGVHLDVRALDELEQLHPHPAGESCTACLRTLKEAVDLHHGDFMQGFTLRDSRGFEEWQLAQSENVRRQLGRALDLLVDSYVALGHDDEALAIAEKRTGLDPLNEPTYRALMRIHARKGERGAVVDSYRALVASLERELGVEPLEETTDLYRALSRGAVPQPSAEKQMAAGDPGRLPFVGRSHEWERLVSAYQSARSLIVAIEGEAGIGKTRLAEEFVSHARSLGAKTVTARSHEGESNVAYGVLTEALRELVTSRVAAQLSEVAVEELARLLPELDVEPADSPVASRFYDAVRSAFEEGLRGERPGVIVFEDLHWSDAATLEVLSYTARRIAETGICLVCTWRTEEIADRELLDRIVGDVPATSIRLGRFGVEELRSLLSGADYSTGDLDATVSRMLTETEGVPYFVTEYVKSVKSSGTWEVPSTVRELVLRRLGSARGVAAQILDAAAVIDRAVDFDMVGRVSGRTDLETADALDELARTGLMQATEDVGRARYEFSHEKLRTVAYEEMSPARRHVLHKRTAEAMIESASVADRGGASAASIARHLELAGANETAAGYYRRAGLWAHRVFAHSQALDHFRHALALGEASSEIHQAIADIHVLQGDYAEAITSYETAAALAEQPETVDRKLGALYLRRGEYDLAEAHLTDALERSEDEAVTTDILVDLSLTARRLGATEDASRYAGDAIERAAKLDDPALRARAENAAGMLSSARGDVDDARSHLQIAFDMATVADDLPTMVAALNNLALVERREGNTTDATELTTQALAACRRFGDRHREAALENNLADLFHENGDPEEAMQHLKRATAIFAEVGADPHGPLPEVWKLVDW
jgi:DNA-binding SARP family transcriptional activator/tetratricopeptide (TPR) repeat protein